jgi:hypothetical protein
MPALSIKSRLAKILAVCAGIAIVSASLGMISALEFASYAISHHKDPGAAGRFSLVLTFILLVGGIVGFMAAVWRVEAKARRELPPSSYLFQLPTIEMP